MDYNEFIDALMEVLEDEICNDVSVVMVETVKNNGYIRRGLTLKEKNVNVSPTIYLEEYYDLFKEGREIDKIANDILGCFYRNRLTRDLDMDFFTDYEKVKHQLFCKLINRDMNPMLLKQVPHEDFLDLAIVVYFKFDESALQGASILIKNEHIEKWGIDSSELLHNAKDNTRYNMELLAEDMNTLLKEMCGAVNPCPIIDESACRMQVVSNKERSLGAVFMIFPEVLEKIAKGFNSDLIILPSSIHEFIVVSANDSDDLEMYSEMVKTVNCENVRIEERLSDRAYLYRQLDGFSV